MRSLDDAFQCVFADFHSLRFRRLCDGGPCSRWRQGANLGKIEKAFRVRFRAAHPASELRQTRSDQNDGQTALRSAVQGDNEGSKLVFFDVLKLVDEHRQGCAALLRRRACGLQQCLEIMLQITIVGEAWLRLKIDADFDVGRLHFERLGEARQSAQSPLGKFLRLLIAGKSQQRLPQLRSEDCRQRTALGRLHAQGVNARGFRILPHPIQQYGLSNAAEADHQDAFRGAAKACSLKWDPNYLAQIISTSEFRRLSARTGCIRIFDGVHREDIIPKLQSLQRNCKLNKLHQNQVAAPVSAASQGGYGARERDPETGGTGRAVGQRSGQPAEAAAHGTRGCWATGEPIRNPRSAIPPGFSRNTRNSSKSLLCIREMMSPLHGSL